MADNMRLCYLLGLRQSAQNRPRTFGWFHIFSVAVWNKGFSQFLTHDFIY